MLSTHERPCTYAYRPGMEELYFGSSSSSTVAAVAAEPEAAPELKITVQE